MDDTPLPLNEFCMTHIAPLLNNMLRPFFCTRFEYLIFLIPDQIHTLVSQAVTSFCYI